MIRALIHEARHSHLEEIEPARVKELVAAKDHIVWIDVIAPTPEEFATLTAEFNFHALAVEDAMKRHQRSKIDEYDDYYFLVLYALTTIQPSPDKCPNVVAEEISIFLGEGYLVTVHSGNVPVMEEAAQRWTQLQEEISPHSGTLLYAIIDSIVDRYFEVVDVLAEQLDIIEEQIFERFDTTLSREILALRKELLTIRRVLTPERDVINTLLRRDLPLLQADLTVYLQDVYDHILRVTETVDTYRDLLSGTLDAYLSTVSNELNQVMKKLTVFSTILMSATLVAGVYGMNFLYMPELAQRWGYPFALGLMLAIAVSLGIYFRRRGWY